jgi:DNA-binding beta-propeller fold protein YncE
MNRTVNEIAVRAWLLAAVLSLGIASSGAFASEPCGTKSYPFPYTDVASITDPFCPGIMEAYVTGVSKGTTATTFSPNNTVTRVEMTTFLQRSLDQGLARTSRRAALNQWWEPQTLEAMQSVFVGFPPLYCAADGKYIWTSSYQGQVVQTQANSGKVLNTWTGATNARGILAAAGKVYVAGETSPGSLYVVDPTLAPGVVTLAASNLGNNPAVMAFDGTHLWTANNGSSVSIITPQASTPYPVTNVTSGFSEPAGMLYDGAHVWVTDIAANTLLKLDPAGAILQTVIVGAGPGVPAFDGANIWVPNITDNSITVVQASTGNVVATISTNTSNNLSSPIAASFDGERVLVTNIFGSTVTVFKAADLSFIANLTTGVVTQPLGPCSDGVNFWVPISNTGALLRF